MHFVIKYLAQRINYHTVAAVINIVAIITYTINANHISLVFYRSCLKQGSPRNTSALGPVGNINEHIVFC